MNTEYLSLISACTALVASIASPVVTLSVAKRQINANVLSANRQKWIEGLRDLIAELISLMVAALVIKNQSKHWDLGRGAIQDNPKLLAKLERIVQVQLKIRLLINPSEADHVQLYKTIDEAFKRIQSNEPSDAAAETDVEEIMRLAQKILKREWVRVKKGT